MSVPHIELVGVGIDDNALNGILGILSANNHECTTKISLQDNKITDPSPITAFKNLKYLNLNDNPIGKDCNLDFLREFSELEELHLRYDNYPPSDMQIFTLCKILYNPGCKIEICNVTGASAYIALAEVISKRMHGTKISNSAQATIECASIKEGFRKWREEANKKTYATTHSATATHGHETHTRARGVDATRER